jgi:histidine ammonia-lyase
MVALGRRIAAVSLLFSSQACDLRDARLGTGTSRAHSQVRTVVPFAGQHDNLPDIEPLVALIAARELCP